MSKKTLAVLSLAIAVVFLLSSTGCVSKKRLQDGRTAERPADGPGQRAHRRSHQEERHAGQESEGYPGRPRRRPEPRTSSSPSTAASLKDQIAALEGQKTELDKALAAGKETEASYQKKVRSLNGAIGDAEEPRWPRWKTMITAKDAEIAVLQQTEASLKAAAEEQSMKIAALNADKDALTAQLDKTVASKKSTTLILGILLALAVILAIVGFLPGKKTRGLTGYLRSAGRLLVKDASRGRPSSGSLRKAPVPLAMTSA